MVMLTASDAAAQCAMCRSTLENNYSNGQPGIASGINTGILYLLVMPYLAVIILGYLWYKSSRNGKKNLSDGVA
jgi:hypothetical protein